MNTTPEDLRRIAADIHAGLLPRARDADILDRAAADLTLLSVAIRQALSDNRFLIKESSHGC